MFDKTFRHGNDEVRLQSPLREGDIPRIHVWARNGVVRSMSPEKLRGCFGLFAQALLFLKDNKTKPAAPWCAVCKRGHAEQCAVHHEGKTEGTCSCICRAPIDPEEMELELLLWRELALARKTMLRSDISADALKTAAEDEALAQEALQAIGVGADGEELLDAP